MRFVPAVLIVLFLSLWLAPPAPAASDLRQDIERLQQLRDLVDVDADSVEYSEADRKVVAKGGVRITLEKRSLFADEVSVDLDDQVLVATGNVVLVEGTNRLEGDRIEYNYRTNLGVVTHGRALLDPGVSFQGVEIRRKGEREYTLKDGAFTTCRACQAKLEIPDWEFRASEATIYQDEWVASRHTSFWVKGIPVLYVPAMALSIGPRRTGFLIPRLGYGNRDGFIYKQPFFWAVSRSQDATLTGIYRTKRGFEFDAEYRYVLGERSHGEMSGRYLHDLEASSGRADRTEFKWLHDQTISPTWAFKADVRYLNDRTLNRDFVDSSVADRTQRILTSNAFLTQATSDYMLLGLVDVTQDLAGVAEERISRLPEVRFQWLPAPLFGSPLLLEAETSGVYLERTHAEDAGRLDVRPVLHLPLRLASFLTATSSVGVRETAYTNAEQPGGDTNRVLVELGERLSTRFWRRFEEPGWGLQRLTHVVEPSLTYQYLPWTDQQSFPQFDQVDFVSPQNRLTYRLVNRLVARRPGTDGQAQTHEVATLGIAQSWNLQPQTREFSDVYLQSLTPEQVDQAVRGARSLGNGFSRATERRLSNLVFDAALSPIPAVALHGTLALDAERPQAEAVNTGVLLQLQDGLAVDVGHSFVRDQMANGVVARILWKASKALSLDLLSRYDVRSGNFFENAAGLRFSTCCWEIGLKYTYRTRGLDQGSESNVQVIFDLKIPAPATAR
jgi:LPS-assembly protein